MERECHNRCTAWNISHEHDDNVEPKLHGFQSVFCSSMSGTYQCHREIAIWSAHSICYHPIWRCLHHSPMRNRFHYRYHSIYSERFQKALWTHAFEYNILRFTHNAYNLQWHPFCFQELENFECIQFSSESNGEFRENGFRYYYNIEILFTFFVKSTWNRWLWMNLKLQLFIPTANQTAQFPRSAEIRLSTAKDRDKLNTGEPL